MVMVMMAGLSGSTAGGGGSCGFEKDGLVPVASAATAAAATAASISAVALLFDRFDFTYFHTQIGQPITVVTAAGPPTFGAATPADIDHLP